jgi:hypothetical protein
LVVVPTCRGSHEPPLAVLNRKGSAYVTHIAERRYHMPLSFSYSGLTFQDSAIRVVLNEPSRHSIYSWLIWRQAVVGRAISHERCSVVVKAVCYKPEGRGSKPDEVNEFVQFT